MEYTSYRQIDTVVDDLFADQKYHEALVLLLEAEEQFPNDLYEILWYKAIINMVLGEHKKSLGILDNMIARKYFSELSWNIFDPIREEEKFKIVFEANSRLKAAAQKKACMEYYVYTPEDYNPDHKYPLFLALHGDGHSVDYFKEYWDSNTILHEGFILVYIQSSQVISTNGFSWLLDNEITRKDIKVAYDEVIRQYSIDTENVLIGGFSR